MSCLLLWIDSSMTVPKDFIGVLVFVDNIYLSYLNFV